MKTNTLKIKDLDLKLIRIYNELGKETEFINRLKRRYEFRD